MQNLSCAHYTDHSKGYLNLRSFDEDYLRRLREGDPPVEADFFQYFSRLLLIKLRSRLGHSDALDDIRQETFARVLTTIRSKTGLRQPERLGPFVVSVCNNVVFEHFRKAGKHDPMPENAPELRDRTIDLHGALVTRQTQSHVREILDKLAPKDRNLLKAVFLEERDKDEICLEFRVDREYLRVLVYRAKREFRQSYEKDMQDCAIPVKRNPSALHSLGRGS